MRSLSRLPAATSTGAPLMPVPPMSTPIFGVPVGLITLTLDFDGAVLAGSADPVDGRASRAPSRSDPDPDAASSHGPAGCSHQPDPGSA